MLISGEMSKLLNLGYFNLFNNLLIKSNGVKFGGKDETISSVIGRNLIANTLSPMGNLINSILNIFDPGHSVNSIKSK